MTSLPDDAARSKLHIRKSQAELKALIDAVDEQAESYLIACVHFAKFMQVDVNQDDAYDVLKAMAEETYERLNYYQRHLDPITDRVVLPPLHSVRGGVG